MNPRVSFPHVPDEMRPHPFDADRESDDGGPVPEFEDDDLPEIPPLPEPVIPPVEEIPPVE